MLDFNVSEQYGSENRCAKAIYPNDYENMRGSARSDLEELGQTLRYILKGWQYPDSNEGADAVKKFRDMIKRLDFLQPDYDALRNILKTELEKHQNKTNFDKFDWQMRRWHSI